VNVAPDLEEAIRRRRDWLENAGIPADSFSEEEILLGCVRQINNLATVLTMDSLPGMIAINTEAHRGDAAVSDGEAIIGRAIDFIYRNGFLRSARRFHKIPVEQK
jgi:hypothetical protein